MSQAKVDRYKEEKKNRQQIMKREKREWMLVKLCGGVLAALIVGWAGFSVYQTINAPSETTDNTVTQVEEVTVDTTALEDYLSSLSVD